MSNEYEDLFRLQRKCHEAAAKLQKAECASLKAEVLGLTGEVPQGESLALRLAARNGEDEALGAAARQQLELLTAVKRLRHSQILDCENCAGTDVLDRTEQIEDFFSDFSEDEGALAEEVERLRQRAAALESAIAGDEWCQVGDEWSQASASEHRVERLRSQASAAIAALDDRAGLMRRCQEMLLQVRGQLAKEAEVGPQGASDKSSGGVSPRLETSGAPWQFLASDVTGLSRPKLGEEIEPRGSPEPSRLSEPFLSEMRLAVEREEATAAATAAAAAAVEEALTSNLLEFNDGSSRSSHCRSRDRGRSEERYTEASVQFGSPVWPSDYQPFLASTRVLSSAAKHRQQLRSVFGLELTPTASSALGTELRGLAHRVKGESSWQDTPSRAAVRAKHYELGRVQSEPSFVPKSSKWPPLVDETPERKVRRRGLWSTATSTSTAEPTAYDEPTVTTATTASREDSSFSWLRSTPFSPSHGGYRPVPSDDIDIEVAKFLSLPEHRLRRALFSRLAPGSYLYGTRRAELRLVSTDRAGVMLEARSGDDEPWVPLEALARRLERAQSAILRRARQRQKVADVTGSDEVSESWSPPGKALLRPGAATAAAMRSLRREPFGAYG